MVQVGPVVCAVGSWMMMIYSSFAAPRGWRQGAWFIGNETLVVGCCGLLFSLYSAYKSDSWTGVIVILALSIIGGNSMIGFFREQSQIISIAGLVVGGMITVFA